MFFYGLPLNRKNSALEVQLNSIQKKTLQEFFLKVKSGELSYREHKCLCGNESKYFDVLIAEQDRYGIPCKNILCKKCSLIRQESILDDGSPFSTINFFEDQVKRGELFLSLIEREVGLKNIKTVFEVGTGAGGILWPFFKVGKAVSGCDYGKEYLKYGIEKGIPLYSGGINKNKTQPKSQDLLIISHVLEHFNDPIIELNNLIDVVREGGYLLIEVPGSLSAAKTYVNPTLYFQNAHVNNFNGSFLNLFFTHLGLEIVYGDENCTFILKKPKDWKGSTKPFRASDELLHISDKVERYFKLHSFLYRTRVSPYIYRGMLISLLNTLRLKAFIKRLFA